MRRDRVTKKPLVEGLPRGYVINVREPNGEEHVYWLLSRCEIQGVGYWCDSHRAFFANRFNLEEHVRTAPDDLHLVAALCPKHGYEAPAVDAPALKVPPHQPKPPEPEPEKESAEPAETAA